MDGTRIASWRREWKRWRRIPLRSSRPWWLLGRIKVGLCRATTTWTQSIKSLHKKTPSSKMSWMTSKTASRKYTVRRRHSTRTCPSRTAVPRGVFQMEKTLEATQDSECLPVPIATFFITNEMAVTTGLTSALLNPRDEQPRPWWTT